MKEKIATAIHRLAGLDTRSQLATIVAVGAIAAAAVVLYAVDPVGVRWMPRCMLHSLTGWQCPSCGLMRATHSALHGHWHEALMYNPMLPVLLGLALVIIVRILTSHPETTGRERPSSQGMTRRLVWAYLLLYCGWGIVRNLLCI